MASSTNLGDILDEDDMTKIITQVVAAAGPDGVHEPVLIQRVEVAANEVRVLKIHAGMYEAFASGKLHVQVVDGEVRYTAP